MSPANIIINKLRAAIEEAEEEIRYYMFSIRDSCEQRLVQDSQVLQE
jgi:hypothetical protein